MQLQRTGSAPANPTSKFSLLPYISLIFTQNCNVNVPVGRTGVAAVGDDAAAIVPVNPVVYGPPVIAMGPVTAGAPQPVANVVFGGTTSETLMLVIFAALVLVPTIKYAIHLPGTVFTLATIAMLLHGAFGVLPVSVVAGVVTQDPVPLGNCWYLSSFKPSDRVV